MAKIYAFNKAKFSVIHIFQTNWGALSKYFRVRGAKKREKKELKIFAVGKKFKLLFIFFVFLTAPRSLN